MATQVQFRRGTTAQHVGFAGADGELTIDSDKETVVVHDGATAGGFPLLRNVVEDLTPVLGGDLDMNSNNIIAAGSLLISPTEMSYLDTVSSNIQTQLDGKMEPGDNVSDLVNDANYQVPVVPGTVNDFAALDASGNIIDGGAQASDFATAAQGTTADSAVQPGDNVSTLTNDANYQGQVVPGTVNDFAALDASGNIIDGGAQASDFATAAQGTIADSAVQPSDNVSTLTNDANYQGQVVPGTANDFAALDASGNIIDGGAQASDFATAAQGTTADSAVQPSDNVSTLTNDASYTTDAAVAVNHYTKLESDATSPAAGAKVDTVVGVSGNVVEFGASNVIADSGVATAALAPLASPVFTGVPLVPTYTIGGAGLPAVGSGGGVIYVSDATGSGVTGSLCFSNGTSWIDVTTGIAVA